MNDYSEVTATLPTRIVRLNDACAQQKWLLVSSIAMDIGRDMMDLAILAMSQQSEIIDKENENV